VIEWTEERALLAARNSDATGWAWRADTIEPTVAHQFPTEGPWMRSRCDEVRWTVRWWTARVGIPLCPECVEASEAAIEREARVILAVAARTAVA
jgi:hypothetical protein